MAIAEREAVAEEQEVQAASAIHLSTADGDSEPLQLQSLCMRCHETVSFVVDMISKRIDSERPRQSLYAWPMVQSAAAAAACAPPTPGHCGMLLKAR